MAKQKGGFLGFSVFFERHKIPCTCSYCRGEHGRLPLWLPKDKSPTSWRVIYIRGFTHRYYLRWTCPRTKRRRAALLPQDGKVTP
jgi:hypothetical protein